MSTAAHPDRTIFIAVTAMTIMGQLGLVFAPFLLTLAMAQAGVGDAPASRILAGEFIGYLLVALAASSLRTFRPRPVAIVACLGYAVGSLASAISTGPETFLIARIVCGMSGGAIMVSANRLIASHDAYARLFAVAIIGTALFAIVGLVAVPAILQHYGPSATYLTLGGFGLVAAATGPWLISGHRAPVTVAGRVARSAWIMLAAYFFSRLSDAALWPYIDRFGHRVGFDTASVGIILSLATVAAVAGPLIALRVTGRREVMLLFAATLLAKAAAPPLMASFQTPAVFVVAQIVVSFTLVLAGQLFLTHFSAVDSSGRLAALGGTVGLTADAAGLAIAGQAFVASGFSGVATASSAIGIVALVLCVPTLALSRPRRGTAPLGSPEPDPV